MPAKDTMAVDDMPPWLAGEGRVHDARRLRQAGEDVGEGVVMEKVDVTHLRYAHDHFDQVTSINLHLL